MCLFLISKTRWLVVVAKIESYESFSENQALYQTVQKLFAQGAMRFEPVNGIKLLVFKYS